MVMQILYHIPRLLMLSLMQQQDEFLPDKVAILFSERPEPKVS